MMRLLFLLGALVAMLFAASLAIGPAEASFAKSLSSLLTDDGTPFTLVMREIRLPRALLAVMIGASLGLAGAAMQGYLRNPLAEPGLIGVSSSAALGAVLSLQTGFAAAFALALPLSALAAALVGVLLVLLLAGPRGASMTLILAGIAISAMAGALISLVLNLSPNPYAANEIVFWMMGSLADRSMLHVFLALPVMALGWILLGTLGRGLDALTLGEDAASSMGINLSRLRLWRWLSASPALLAQGRLSLGRSALSGLLSRTSCAPSWAVAPRGFSGPLRLVARRWFWRLILPCA